MIETAILEAWSPEIIAVLVRSIVDKIDNETAVQLFHPGTVVADTYDGVAHIATLVMDGSGLTGPQVTTQAYVLIPQVLFAGQRVMVFYDKPHVAYVIGSVSLPIPPGVRLSNCDQSNLFQFADDVDTTLNFSCIEEQTSGMLVASGVVTVPQDGLYSANLNGTYVFANPPAGAVAFAALNYPAHSTSGFALTQISTTLYSSGPLQLTATRVPMRAGEDLWIQMVTSGTDSGGSLYNVFFEVSFLGPFVDQYGCQCSGG